MLLITDNKFSAEVLIGLYTKSCILAYQQDTEFNKRVIIQKDILTVFSARQYHNNIINFIIADDKKRRFLVQYVQDKSNVSLNKEILIFSDKNKLSKILKYRFSLDEMEPIFRREVFLLQSNPLRSDIDDISEMILCCTHFSDRNLNDLR